MARLAVTNGKIMLPDERRARLPARGWTERAGDARGPS
jgi:hypothetical protein